MPGTRKGMSAALTLVITAVVLIVISLVVITIVSGGLGNFFKRSDVQSNQSATGLDCAAALSYCDLQKQTLGAAAIADVRYNNRRCGDESTSGTIYGDC